MRILMVGPARTVNGGISAVVNNYYDAGLDKKVEIEYIGTMEDGSKWHKLYVAIRAFVKFIFCVPKYELVHVHMASDISIYRKLPFIWLTAVYGKKLIIHQHGGDVKHFLYAECGIKRREFIKKILQKADVFLVVAPFLKDVFKDIIEENKIIVFPNAIQIPKEINPNYKEQNILFLGRICRQKGIYELLDAVEMLKIEFPKLNLFLGGIWEEEELEKKAEECGEFVQYLGWVNKEEKDAYLQKCNVFVLPTYFEGLPMSLLEGMAYGCACIASAVGGIPQIMINEENGLMIQEKNVKALAEAIRKLFNNPELQKKLGTNGRKTVEDNFEINNSVLKLMQIYKGVRDK